MMQPNETEYATMQQECDQFYVGHTSYSGSIHLYEDCRNLQRTDNLKSKPTEAYPFAYFPICEVCLDRWDDE